MSPGAHTRASRLFVHRAGRPRIEPTSVRRRQYRRTRDDPSAVPSALGIEAVEWIAEGGENLTVRVTGRWRRRRPDWSGKPTLVIEATGRRYRFPAIPEPPSLSGAAPGMWRITFAVPAALAPDPGARAWLQFGSVSVPLPSAVQSPGGVNATEASESSPAGRPALGEVEAVPAPAPATGERQPPSSAPGGPPPSGPPPTPRALAAIRRAEESEAAVQALTGVVRDLERDLAAARTRAEDLATALAGQAPMPQCPAGGAHADGSCGSTSPENWPVTAARPSGPARRSDSSPVPRHGYASSKRSSARRGAGSTRPSRSPPRPPRPGTGRVSRLTPSAGSGPRNRRTPAHSSPPRRPRGYGWNRS